MAMKTKNLDPADLITELYRALLGRDPEPTAIPYWSGVIDSRGISALLSGILESPEARRVVGQRLGREMVPANTRSRDMVLKELKLPHGAAGWLALPLGLEDPIVTTYLEGHQDNDYMLEILLELTEAGDRVLDLGAHLGTFCVPAALLGRHVLAIDASRRHTEALETSRRINDLTSLTVVHCAVADNDGPVAFHEDGLFGRVDFTGSAPSTVAVQGRRLDALLEEHRFSDLSFLKMDIEGSELLALRTLSYMLRSDVGPAILFESNAETFAQAGYAVSDARKWLEEAGYHTYRLEGARWVYAPPLQMQPEMWVDMLALKPRHEQRFASRIDRDWRPEAMRDRCLEWAALPYANTRQHLAAVLGEANAFRHSFPEMERLMQTLKQRNTPEQRHHE